MFSKKTIFLGLIVSIVIAVCLCDDDSSSGNKADPSHNLVAGNRDPADHLGYQGYVIRLGIFGTVLNVEQTYEVDRNENITQVLAFDQSIGNRGGYAELVKGGPNDNFVTIKFTSQRGAGILHRVQIYAK
uniref:Uncharacterized protein n=1 Tax=Bracon brevicornis TaxID=1563983 RepID=A0A6V7IZ10_9HYME